MKFKRMSLKAARIDANFKQKDLATALGVSRKTVAAWECGKTMPKADKIDKICEILGRSYDEIQWQP